MFQNRWFDHERFLWIHSEKTHSRYDQIKSQYGKRQHYLKLNSCKPKEIETDSEASSWAAHCKIIRFTPQQCSCRDVTTILDDVCDNINALYSFFHVVLSYIDFSAYLHGDSQKPRVLSLTEPSLSICKKCLSDYNSVNRNSSPSQPKYGAGHHTQPCSSEQK